MLKRLTATLKTFTWLCISHEDGQDLIEYALIILFVAIALVGAIGLVAPPLGAILSNAGAFLSGA